MGAAAILVAVPDPAGLYGGARAALVIHGPDGRPVVPMDLEPVEQPLLLLSSEAAARGAQLSEEDVRLYRRIFAHQDRGEWEAADTELRRITDKRLLGHVLRHRLLHPDRKAGYEELVSWLRSYGDHAGAERIHQLASRRAPAGAKLPKAQPRDGEKLTGSLERMAGSRPPMEKAAVEATEGTEGGGEAAEESVTVAPRTRTKVRRTDGMARVEDLVRAGRTGAALTLLGEDEVSRQMDSVQYDTARARIASALYYAGEVTQALSLASASAARSGDAVPNAHWIAGLAAWRLKQHERASRHFDAMVAARPDSPWQFAAAAYWAARAHAKRGRADEARAYLNTAARFPHTFYGLVASRTLGKTAELRWQLPELTERHLATLAERPEGARAIALVQVGRKDMAEAELRRIHPRGNALVEEAMIAIADRAGLPALALQVGNAVTAPDGAPYDAALFPLPHWTPRDGFSVDRALVFAVIRQESRFDPRSVSPAGAAGLMQIMPATAAHVMERHTDIHDDDASRNALFDPSTNMELGQRYLAELLAMPDIGNNLFLLAAAYNAGPGHLNKWRKDQLGDVQDPLLFIESMPFGETRDYVEKVLANFWIYRLRLGQGMGSLDAVAAGGWPVYMPVDVRPTQVAQHAED